jgi:cytochrome bd ubiquinol oxidase subunit I
VASGMVLSTLIAYLAVYGALLLAYMWVITYLATKAAKGEPIRDMRVTSPAPNVVPAE